jgi:hypothetical protein
MQRSFCVTELIFSRPHFPPSQLSSPASEEPQTRLRNTALGNYKLNFSHRLPHLQVPAVLQS